MEKAWATETASDVIGGDADCTDPTLRERR